MKRILAALCMLALAGCGKTEASKKVVVWHWMTDRHQAFEQLAAKYKQQTGVEVEFKKFFPPDIYSTKVIAAARAGTLPDIFGILGEKKVLASFAKSGYIVDFGPELVKDGWKDRFYAQTLATTAFDKGNIYDAPVGFFSIPLDATSMQFAYNKALLKQAGFEGKTPQTLDEMIAMAKAVKEKVPGVDGFVCGWGEVWLLHCLATEWAINVMGEEKFFATLKGDVKYTDQQWVDVLSKFVELKNSGIMVSDIITMVNRESEDNFSRGASVFSFDGGWAVNVYKQLAPELDYGFFPIVKVAKDSPAKIWAGAGSSLAVSNTSKNKSDAVAFLKWLTEKEQQAVLVKETNNLPSVKGLEDMLSPQLKDLASGLESSTHPNVWPFEEDSRVIEIFDKGLQQLILGEKTPQEVAEKIQQVKDSIKK
jgi:raffinose/stachyose/melibiose transport system substrate-binding protein